jgi:diacylglycerol kinase family enzyme
LGQANLPFEDLVAGWADAWRQRFDVGLARGPWGTFRFLESVGAGLLADSMAEIKEGRADYIRQAKGGHGRMAAALRLFHGLLGRMAAMRFNLSVDGRDRSGEYLLLEVLNFGAAGPNLRLAPHAAPSDGLLDVVLVDEHHRRDLADHLSLSSRMDSVRTPTLPVYPGRHITLSCGGCHLHLDDEVWTGQRAEDPIVIDLSVEPHALTFLVPHVSVRPLTAAAPPG